jgi:acetyl esterase/lipase
VRARNVPDGGESAVLYFHGGGFVTGSYRSHRGLASRLSLACGAPVLLPEYRLAPEHPHPAPDDDCLAAYRALLEAGRRPEKILLAGDSAGGFLTLQTLLSARDTGLPLPRAAVLLSPLTDARHLDGDSYTNRRDVDVFLDPDGVRYLTGLYTAGTAGDGDALSPVRRDLTGLPPMLVHVGDHEILLSDSVRLVERAQACGVDATLTVWPEMWHVFQLFAMIERDAARAVQQIGEFARKQLA